MLAFHLHHAAGNDTAIAFGSATIAAEAGFGAAFDGLLDRRGGRCC